MDDRGQTYLQRRTTAGDRASRNSLLETYIVAAEGSEVHSCIIQVNMIQHCISVLYLKPSPTENTE